MNNYMKTIISGLKQWVSSQKSDWNQNDSSAANFIKNRPFYSEEKEKVLFSGNIETVDENGLGFAGLSYIPYEIGQEYKVIFADTAYICKAFSNVNIWSGQAVLLGNLGMLEPEGEDTGEPFCFVSVPEEMTFICTQTAGTYSISILGTVEEVHQIDSKYVPMPDLADVAHTGDYYDLQNTPYIPWDTVQYANSQSLPDANKKIARNNIGAAAATDVSNLNTTVSSLSTQIEDATDECITGLSVSGKTITYTKGDNSTGTITTQDTTYSEATTSTNGLMSAADKTKLDNTVQNLKDGTAAGSMRSVTAAAETDTYSLGRDSIALGEGTSASGSYSFAAGKGAKASGLYSCAQGFMSYATAKNSHAEGFGVTAASECQHVQGKNNIADSSGKYLHIVGNGSNSAPSNAHTIDWNGVGWFKGGLKVGGTSQDDAAAVEVALKSDVEAAKNDLLNGAGEAYDTLKELGDLIDDSTDAIAALETVAANKVDKKDGITGLSVSGKVITYTKGNGSTGTITTQDTTYSNATTSAAGLMSAADKTKLDGFATINNLKDGSATGSLRSVNAKSESSSYSLGDYAMATGYNTVASGQSSHAEGNNTTASKNYSHAEGSSTIASGLCSHAEGNYTVASGSFSHSEGYQSLASGFYSHAEGTGTKSSIKLTGEASSTNYQVSTWNNNIKTGNIIVYENSTAKIVSINEANNEITLDKTLSNVALSNTYVTIYFSGIASGSGSHIEGSNTIASKDYSHAEGDHTIAASTNQHVQGKYNIEDSSNKYAHIVGNGSSDTARSNAHTLDWNGIGWFKGGLKVGGTSQDDPNAKEVVLTEATTTAAGLMSAADKTKVNGIATNLVNGSATGSLRGVGARESSGINATAFGYVTTASGRYSHAEGYFTTASGNSSHAEGYDATASGNYSHAEGNNTTASGESSHAEGQGTVAFGNYSHAEGQDTVAFGNYSHAEGKGFHINISLTGEASSTNYQVSTWNNNIKTGTVIIYQNSTAKIVSINEANNEIVLNKTLSDVTLSDVSVTLCYAGVASGDYSHMEGYQSIASGLYSHAEGYRTLASAYSHAEGEKTIASGPRSHAEGSNTTASGVVSHAEGSNTTASGDYSHVQGKYNVEDSSNKYAHIVGNGSSDTARSNAHTLDWDGNAWFAGKIYVGGTSQDDAAAVEVALKSDLASLSAPTAISLTRIDEICNQTIYSASEVEV